MDFGQFKSCAMHDYEDAKHNGLADKDIIRHLDNFNKLKNYYTTSSCSGRIMLVKNKKGVNKSPDSFYYKSHAPAKFLGIIKAINSFKEDSELWLKSEPFILHIGCRKLEDAKKLLNYCHIKGIKRTGIISFSKRIIVEVIGTQLLITILIKNKKLIAGKDYIKALIKESNLKLKETKKILYGFFKDSKKALR